MKKIIATITAILCIMSTAEAELYYRFGKVIDHKHGLITVEDRTGNSWEFWGDNNGFIILIMDDNGTADITDDIVVNVF